MDAKTVTLRRNFNRYLIGGKEGAIKKILGRILQAKLIGMGKDTEAEKFEEVGENQHGLVAEQNRE
jgi:hypothetical protein